MRENIRRGFEFMSATFGVLALATGVIMGVTAIEENTKFIQAQAEVSVYDAQGQALEAAQTLADANGLLAERNLRLAISAAMLGGAAVEGLCYVLLRPSAPSEAPVIPSSPAADPIIAES